MAKMKKMLPWLCIAAVVLWTLFGASGRSVRAQNIPSPDPNDIIAKLDIVLENQKAILFRIASIQDELRVIKIRITQQQ